LSNKPFAQIQEDFERITRDIETTTETEERKLLLRQLLLLIEEADKLQFEESAN
jgi:hypothetical protein